MPQNYTHPAAPARKNGVQTTSLQLSLLNFLIEEKQEVNSQGMLFIELRIDSLLSR